MVKKNAEGRERVEERDGKYAFFMESATIEYIQERYCNLTQIGGLIDNKGYGIATKKGSPLRGPLTEAILKLQETGVLHMLKDRWWKQKGGGQCIAKPPPAMTELGVRNLGGVFLVLAVGGLVAIFLAVCEFLFKTKMASEEVSAGGGDKVEFKESLCDCLLVLGRLRAQPLGRFYFCPQLLGVDEGAEAEERQEPERKFGEGVRVGESNCRVALHGGLSPGDVFLTFCLF